ncbi:uncharacterized protein [Dendrobates tinctorius]|uniref:uncharacterized protein n=1 Tax=Dendrobates tinctorius TaxID=92724 RepID=UPI003CCA4E03
MSSSDSSPSHHQRTEEAEELAGGDMQGGETQGGGAQSSSQSGACTRATPRTSQCRRGDASGGRQTVSQRTPRRPIEEGLQIDTDDLIHEVETQEPLWNMRNRLHADQPTTQRLWDEVCSAVVENWEELNEGARDLVRDRFIARWWSLRDRHPIVSPPNSISICNVNFGLLKKIKNSTKIFFKKIPKKGVKYIPKNKKVLKNLTKKKSYIYTKKKV